MTITAVLLVLAFVAFIVAAVGISVPKINLIALGLALWLLAQLLSGVKV